MRLEIRSKELMLTEAIDAYVSRRMRLALGRFGPRLGRIMVRVGDENGPRGGVDKCCRVVAQTSTGTVVVEELDRDLYVAIDRASERVARAVGRAVLRSREMSAAWKEEQR